MNRMKDDSPQHHIDLAIDDLVMIVDGPFKELEGKVGEIDTARGKVKVLVSMFGRETPVELDFLQVKKGAQNAGARGAGIFCCKACVLPIFLVRYAGFNRGNWLWNGQPTI